MHDAALRARVDPDRLSFLHAVRVARRKLPLYGAIPPRDQKAYRRRIPDEVLQERVPPRPPRRNTRGVKRKMSGYGQTRQRASQPCSKPIIQIVK
jgi:hypothetical protein